MDEIGVWHRALSLSELTAVYQNITSGVSYPFTPTGGNFSVASINSWDSLAINTFNLTITSGATQYNYSTTTGTITTGILQNSISLWNITIRAQNQFDNTTTNLNVSSNYVGRLDQYPVIYLRNKWNNSNVSNTSVNIDGTTYSTSNHLNYIPLNAVKNVTTNATNYFSTTNQLNLSPNSANQINISQSIINFSARETTLNTSYSNYSIYLNSTLICNTTTSSCNFAYPNAGSYNAILISNDGNFFNTNTSINISSLQNNTVYLYADRYRLNITARDISDNSTITTFQINITDLNTSYNNIYLSNSNSVIASVTNHTYNLFIDATGYSLYNNIANITINGSNNYIFYLQKNNGVAITIYNESTGAILSNTTTTIYIYIGTTLISTNTTSTGNITFYNLNASNYTFRFEASGFNTKEYYVSVGNRSFQYLNAYLIQTVYSTIFTFLDETTGSTIEGITITVQRYINGTLQIVSALTSDVTGRTSLSYEPITPYFFTCIKSGYVTKTFTLNPILFSSYIVKMVSSINQPYTQDYSGVTIIYNPQSFINSQINPLTFTFTSPPGKFTNYGFNVTYKGLTNVSSDNNAYGSSVSANINITNASFQDTAQVVYYYYTSDGGFNSYAFNIPIIVNVTGTNTINSMKGQTYGIGDFERIIIFTLVLIVFVGMTTMFGGPFIGGVIGIFICGFFAYQQFVVWWSVYPSMLFMFVYAIWGGSK